MRIRLRYGRNLELSDQKFKITVIHMLRALMDKRDNMPEQMGNVSVEMEFLRENTKRNATKIVTEMKTDFDVFISRLDTTEKRISELDDMSMQTSQTEKTKRKKAGKRKEKNRIFKNYGKIIKGIMHM